MCNTIVSPSILICSSTIFFTSSVTYLRWSATSWGTSYATCLLIAFYKTLIHYVYSLPCLLPATSSLLFGGLYPRKNGSSASCTCSCCRPSLSDKIKTQQQHVPKKQDLTRMNGTERNVIRSHLHVRKWLNRCTTVERKRNGHFFLAATVNLNQFSCFARRSGRIRTRRVKASMA